MIAVRRWRILIVINLNVISEKRAELYFGGEGQYSPLSALSSKAHSSAVYTHAACDNQKHESTALIATRPFHGLIGIELPVLPSLVGWPMTKVLKGQNSHSALIKKSILSSFELGKHAYSERQHETKRSFFKRGGINKLSSNCYGFFVVLAAGWTFCLSSLTVRMITETLATRQQRHGRPNPSRCSP